MFSGNDWTLLFYNVLPYFWVCSSDCNLLLLNDSILNNSFQLFRYFRNRPTHMATESEIGKKKLIFSNTVHDNDQNKCIRNGPAIS